MINQIEPGAGSLLTGVMEQYGVMGVAFAVVLFLMNRQNKRVEKLESDQKEQHENQLKAQKEQYEDHLKSQKETIEEYVELVKGNTTMVSQLTAVLSAMKETLDQIRAKG